MKLKYHFETKSEGLLVLESEPQMRSIFVQSQNKNIIRVPFPYVQHVIRYLKVKGDIRGKFLFPGVYGSGLRVFGTLSPLSSMDDEVFLLPTDSQSGFVCTDHSKDNMKYNNLFELTNDIVSLWWNTPHYCSYQVQTKTGSYISVSLNDWENSSLDKINEFPWPQIVDAFDKRKNKSAFWDALKVGYYYWQDEWEFKMLNIKSFDIVVPADGQFIDEIWNPKEITLQK